MRRFQSHYIPRTRNGRLAVASFVFLFVFTQEPWIGGVPFLYAYLLAFNWLLIGVLLWARKHRL